MTDGRAIYKYPFNVSDRFTILMPSDAQILDVQVQGEQPCIWALVTPGAEPEERTFRVIGTGHPYPDEPEMTHRGTFQLLGGAFVGHLFEEVSR